MRYNLVSYELLFYLKKIQIFWHQYRVLSLNSWLTDSKSTLWPFALRCKTKIKIQFIRVLFKMCLCINVLPWNLFLLALLLSLRTCIHAFHKTIRLWKVFYKMYLQVVFMILKCISNTSENVNHLLLRIR